MFLYCIFLYCMFRIPISDGFLTHKGVDDGIIVVDGVVIVVEYVTIVDKEVIISVDVIIVAGNDNHVAPPVDNETRVGF